MFVQEHAFYKGLCIKVRANSLLCKHKLSKGKSSVKCFIKTSLYSQTLPGEFIVTRLYLEIKCVMIYAELRVVFF